MWGERGALVCSQHNYVDLCPHAAFMQDRRPHLGVGGGEPGLHFALAPTARCHTLGGSRPWWGTMPRVPAQCLTRPIAHALKPIVWPPRHTLRESL